MALSARYRCGCDSGLLWYHWASWNGLDSMRAESAIIRRIVSKVREIEELPSSSTFSVA